MLYFLFSAFQSISVQLGRRPRAMPVFSDVGEQNASEKKHKFAYQRARIWQPQSSVPLKTFKGEIAENENDIAEQHQLFDIDIVKHNKRVTFNYA